MGGAAILSGGGGGVWVSVKNQMLHSNISMFYLKISFISFKIMHKFVGYRK